MNHISDQKKEKTEKHFSREAHTLPNTNCKRKPEVLKFTMWFISYCPTGCWIAFKLKKSPLHPVFRLSNLLPFQAPWVCIEFYITKASRLAQQSVVGAFFFRTICHVEGPFSAVHDKPRVWRLVVYKAKTKFTIKFICNSLLQCHDFSRRSCELAEQDIQVFLVSLRLLSGSMSLPNEAADQLVLIVQGQALKFRLTNATSGIGTEMWYRASRQSSLVRMVSHMWQLKKGSHNTNFHRISRPETSIPAPCGLSGR